MIALARHARMHQFAALLPLWLWLADCLARRIGGQVCLRRNVFRKDEVGRAQFGLMTAQVFK